MATARLVKNKQQLIVLIIDFNSSFKLNKQLIAVLVISFLTLTFKHLF